jgi:hypothetical protein
LACDAPAEAKNDDEQQRRRRQQSSWQSEDFLSSRMEWQMISFLSFLCHSIYPSLSASPSCTRLFFLFFFFSALCLLLTLPFYQIYSLLNQSLPYFPS